MRGKNQTKIRNMEIRQKMNNGKNQKNGRNREIINMEKRTFSIEVDKIEHEV